MDDWEQFVNSGAKHEAGHAIVAELLGIRVTAIESDASNGYVTTERSNDPAKEGVVAMAGLAAIELLIGPGDFEGEDQTSDDCDKPRAREHAGSVLGPEGDIDGLVEEWRQEALALLRPNQKLIHELADQIRLMRVLPGDDVRRVMAMA